MPVVIISATIHDRETVFDERGQDSNTSLVDKDMDGTRDTFDPQADDAATRAALRQTSGAPGQAARRLAGGPARAAASLLAALCFVALAVPAAHAQDAPENDAGAFPIERFRLAMDRDGILNTEWGAVPGHLSWDLALLFHYQDDPLVLYGEDGEALGSLVASRTTLSLMPSVALWDRLEIGLELPIIVAQSEDDIDGAATPELGGSGIGDVRISPKIQLLWAERSGANLALIPSLTVPTGSAVDYRGEDGISLAPELAVSRAFGAVRLAANLGYRFRPDASVADLEIEDELFLRIAGGYRLSERGGPPLDLNLALNTATAAASPLSDDNQNHFEALAGASYHIGPVVALVGGGLGLNDGFGTPDWRIFLGARVGRVNGIERDGDEDGILDEADACPEAAEDSDGFEDTDGCPDPDNDGDGIEDAADGAPDQPEDMDGYQDEDGVPDPDNDGDEIADTKDACPDEAENRNDYQDEDGCPDEIPDSDSDGLSDRVDECPDNPEDLDGFEDADGCPDPDNDDDKLFDAADRCPNEAGPPENRGCPDTDRDGDGVVDRLDNCPDEAGSANNQGCKKRQRVRLAGTRIEILERVFFQTGRAKIRRRSFALLDNVAQVLISHPEIENVEIEGHTDSRGPEKRNLELSQLRAESVLEYLVGAGVERSRLTPKGYGESKPLEPNKTRRGRAANRRVEFTIRDNAAGAAVEAVEDPDAELDE